MNGLCTGDANHMDNIVRGPSGIEQQRVHAFIPREAVNPRAKLNPKLRGIIQADEPFPSCYSTVPVRQTSSRCRMQYVSHCYVNCQLYAARAASQAHTFVIVDLKRLVNGHLLRLIFFSRAAWHLTPPRSRVGS